MIVFILLLLGLCFGSFVNALVWRIHEQSKPKSKQPKGVNLSIMNGRSVCTHCDHQLAAKDLLPVISWLSLGGKCRYCRRPISWQYPLVEALTALLFVLSYLWWPYTFVPVTTFQFCLWLVFIVGFMALAVYDLRWTLLPDRLIIPLIVLAAFQAVAIAIWHQFPQLLLGSILGAALLAGLFYIIFQVSDGAWIGGGDVKLAVILGLIVGGPVHVILLLFFASILGLVASAPFLLIGRKDLTSRVPFGPFLLIATGVVLLFGATIINWYGNLLLLR